MKKLLESIATRIKYILSNTSNPLIIKECNIINEKLNDFKNNVITDQDLVDYVCNKIIGYDIDMMKRVPGQTNMVYKKMDELATFVEQIKTTYLPQ